MPKETSPFPAHEFDDSVEHIVLAEDDPVMTETAVHRLLDTRQGAILLADGCDEGLYALCSNLAGVGQIERLSIQHMTPRLRLGGSGVLVADAGSLGRQPQRLLDSWRVADPTAVIIVTGSKQQREALLGELSGGLVHRFLIVPTSSGQTRLVLASALKRHQELRRVGYTGTVPALPGLETTGFPAKPAAIAAASVLLGLAGMGWWLAGTDDTEVEALPPTPVADILAPAPEPPVGENTDGVGDATITRSDTTAVDPAPAAPSDVELAQRALANNELVGELGAVALFKKALGSDPNNVAAQQGLAAAEQVLLDRVALALVEGRVEDAEFALADLAYASPNQPRLQALDAEIRDARAAQAVVSPTVAPPTVDPPTLPPPVVSPPPVQPDMGPLRALVRQRITDVQLLEPAGDSARFHLDALSDAGDDAEVIATLEASLRSAALDQVGAALAAGELDRAEQLLVTATLVGADAARLADLQAAVTGSQQQVLLTRAIDAMRANRLVAPPGDNAVELLTTLKTQQAALAGLDAVLTTATRRLSLVAEAALAQQDHAGAASAINAINALRPESPALEPLQRGLRYSQRQADLLAEVVPASDLRILSYETPKYPRQAERRGIEGWVDVEFTVTDAGIPSEMIVVAAQPEAVFDESALTALTTVQFEPYTEDGAIFARRVLMRFRFNFAD